MEKHKHNPLSKKLQDKNKAELKALKKRLAKLNPKLGLKEWLNIITTTINLLLKFW